MRSRLQSIGGDAVGAFRELWRIPKEARAHRPRPPETGLVLEVGGGESPHARADVVVDKYLLDDFERGGALDLSKPLVIADGHRLPFADGTFDYVLTLHVLEHATDPIGFASELARVAKAGFVQVPSRESELTFGWTFHPWLIDRVGDTLRFSPKGDLRAPVGQMFHESYAESPLTRLWWASNRSRWHHSLEWRGSISVEVEEDSAAEQTAQFDPERTLAALADLSRRGELRPQPAAVVEGLRCPVCHGVLSGEERLECAGCGRSYPQIGAVPVLLEEAAA